MFLDNLYHLTAPLDFGAVGNLDAALNSEVVVTNELGFNTVGFFASPPAGGTIAFETTYDGINWEPTSVRGITSDEITAHISTAGNFIGSISTNRSVRFRVEVAGSGTGTVMGRLQRDASVIETIEFNAPPHKFGYTPQHRSKTYTTAQTGAVIWDPGATFRYVITDMALIVGGTTDGRITVFDEVNDEDHIVFNGLIDISNNKQFAMSHAFRIAMPSGAQGNRLRITSSAAMAIDVMVHGYHINGV